MVSPRYPDGSTSCLGPIRRHDSCHTASGRSSGPPGFDRIAGEPTASKHLGLGGPEEACATIPKSSGLGRHDGHGGTKWRGRGGGGGGGGRGAGGGGGRRPRAT